MSDSLVLRKLDQWQDWKFGFMMHWGPYSQWGVVESWSICSEDWIKSSAGIGYVEYKEKYQALPTTFNPIGFDLDVWASVAREAGMKYVVFTTKHHDGFSMFDTKQTDYRITAPDVPFHTNPRANIDREVFAPSASNPSGSARISPNLTGTVLTIGRPSGPLPIAMSTTTRANTLSVGRSSSRSCIDRSAN